MAHAILAGLDHSDEDLDADSSDKAPTKLLRRTDTLQFSPSDPVASGVSSRGEDSSSLSHFLGRFVVLAEGRPALGRPPAAVTVNVLRGTCIMSLLAQSPALSVSAAVLLLLPLLAGPVSRFICLGRCSCAAAAVAVAAAVLVCDSYGMFSDEAQIFCFRYADCCSLRFSSARSVIVRLTSSPAIVSSKHGHTEISHDTVTCCSRVSVFLLSVLNPVACVVRFALVSWYLER